MWLKIVLFSLSLVVYTEAAVLSSPCSPASSPCNATHSCCCRQNGCNTGSCGCGSCGCEKKIDLCVKTGADMCHCESGCSKSDCGCGPDSGCACQSPSCVGDSSEMNKASMACPCQSPSCVGDSSEMNKASMACPCQSPSCVGASQFSYCEPFPNDCVIKKMHCLIDKMEKCRLPVKCSGMDPRLAQYYPGCMAFQEFGALLDNLEAQSAFDNHDRTMGRKMGPRMGRKMGPRMGRKMGPRMGKKFGDRMARPIVNHKSADSRREHANRILKTLIASYKGTASTLMKLDYVLKRLRELKSVIPEVKTLEERIRKVSGSPPTKTPVRFSHRRKSTHKSAHKVSAGMFTGRYAKGMKHGRKFGRASHRKHK